jgi:hypothetical protein
VLLNQPWIKRGEYVFHVIFLALDNKEEKTLVKCTLEFSLRDRMLRIKSCLVITFCIILQMPLKKQCSFPKHIQYGTSIVLDRKHIPAEALKFAKSEYGMRDMRRNLWSGCTAFLTRSTLKVSLNAPFIYVNVSVQLYNQAVTIFQQREMDSWWRWKHLI